jgi:hypothetical protein
MLAVAKLTCINRARVDRRVVAFNDRPNEHKQGSERYAISPDPELRNVACRKCWSRPAGSSQKIILRASWTLNGSPGPMPGA